MYLPIYQKQRDFLDSTALYRAFVAGRGSGKSWVGGYDLICRAKPWRTYSVVDPNARMSRDDTFPRFEKLARELGAWSHVKLSPYPDVYLRNNAVVRFRSADDPELLRGPDLTGCWLNEASLMHASAFPIVIACLRECGEQGWLTATFTPRGPSHWTHAEFATNKPNTALIRAATFENPFLDQAFAATLQQQYGETLFARQELGGEFVQLEGAEFPAEWFAGEDLWFDAWPEDLVLKIIALDPSKGTGNEDYQAHVMIGVRIEGNRYVYYVDAHLEREGALMCDRTATIVQQFSATGRRVDSVIVEDNGTMGLLQAAMDAASVKAKTYIPYRLVTNTENKERRISYRCAPPLSRRQFRFRRTKHARMLVGQLQSFPHDEYDDGPDALATALFRVAEMLGGGT